MREALAWRALSITFACPKDEISRTEQLAPIPTPFSYS